MSPSDFKRAQEWAASLAKQGISVQVFDHLIYKTPVPPGPPQDWRPIPIGDLVERGLTAIGVTKERVERWTRTAGKPGGCGCDGRKKWMNDVGNRVQVAARQKLLKVRDFYFGQS